MRGVIKTVLRAIGITQILEAESGPAAITVLRESPVDIVFHRLDDGSRCPAPSWSPYLAQLGVQPQSLHPDRHGVPPTPRCGTSSRRATSGSPSSWRSRSPAKGMLRAHRRHHRAPREPFIRAKEYFGPDPAAQGQGIQGFGKSGRKSGGTRWVAIAAIGVDRRRTWANSGRKRRMTAAADYLVIHQPNVLRQKNRAAHRRQPPPSSAAEAALRVLAVSYPAELTRNAKIRAGRLGKAWRRRASMTRR